MSIKSTSKPRVRRTPEASRENILAAAERLLVKLGPQSLRLADVAAEADVANATVLHHFGSIDRLQTGLMEKMIAELVTEILGTPLDDDPAAARREALHRVFNAFEKKGAARLAAWLELTDESRRLVSVREAVQTVIRQRTSKLHDADPEEMEDAILIGLVVAVGVGLFGPTISSLLGKEPARARALALALLEANDPAF